VRSSALGAARLLEWLFFPALVLVVSVGLVAPAAGRALSGGVIPLFALMMFAVSLTFHVDDVRRVVREPWPLVLATLAVFGPLPLLARLVAPVLFGPGALALGFILLAALPTDISAPLFTAMGRGTTALTAVVNAIVTALSPFILPLWFLALTGLRLQVPVAALVVELVLVVIVPTVAGVGVRSLAPPVAELDAVWQAAAAAIYLMLVGIVVSQDAGHLDGIAPGRLFAVVGGVLALNLLGYLLGWVPWRASPRRPADRLAYTLAVGEKEFSVAVAVVYAAGLDRALLVPAVVASVVQVVTATLLARRARRHHAHAS
jgi:bile acid:Na+ symporter, BASS family